MRRGYQQDENLISTFLSTEKGPQTRFPTLNTLKNEIFGQGGRALKERDLARGELNNLINN